MAISKQALALVKNKEKELINRKKSKYQDYEADIMFLKKEGFSVSRIAQFLEDTYNLKNDKSFEEIGTKMLNIWKLSLDEKTYKEIPNETI